MITLSSLVESANVYFQSTNSYIKENFLIIKGAFQQIIKTLDRKTPNLSVHLIPI